MVGGDLGKAVNFWLGNHIRGIRTVKKITLEESQFMALGDEISMHACIFYQIASSYTCICH